MYKPIPPIAEKFNAFALPMGIIATPKPNPLAFELMTFPKRIPKIYVPKK
jgi:hypothetical protein